MSLFKPARENIAATFKAAVFGEAGSGKTFTATQFAIGFLNELKVRDPERAAKPIYFIDTENGSDFMIPVLEQAGFKDVRTLKTRAFTDLVPALKEADAEGSILIIDSITHFWVELVDSFTSRNKRPKGLAMSDWGFLKKKWGEFTTAYIASGGHIIMAGRAGFEYEFGENEDTGKKEIEKSGVKMKGESGMAYEPNLMVYMQRQQEMDGKDVAKTWHTATIVKDRTTMIDGQTFKDPTYENIAPHVACLALGTKVNSVDVNRTSEHAIPNANGKGDWQLEQEEKERILEEIKDVLSKHFPGSSAAEKEQRAQKFESHFGTRTWSRIEQMDLNTVKTARNALWLELEGKPYAITLPQPKDTFGGDFLPGDGPVAAQVQSTAEALGQAAGKVEV